MTRTPERLTLDEIREKMLQAMFERLCAVVATAAASPEVPFGIVALKHLCGDNDGFTCSDYSDEWAWKIAGWARKNGLAEGWSGHSGHMSCALTDAGRSAIQSGDQFEHDRAA